MQPEADPHRNDRNTKKGCLVGEEDESAERESDRIKCKGGVEKEAAHGAPL